MLLLLLAPACNDGVAPLELRVMTFNIGTTQGLDHDGGDDAYTGEDAARADAWYGNGLSWRPAEQALSAFLATERPDVVVFQEGFYDPWCAEMPVEQRVEHFICSDWSPGDPLQIERLLGEDYQVACAPGQEDNCAGVRLDFGAVRGCDGPGFCEGALDGLETPGDCGRGARVSALTVDRPDGRALTVVDLHGTSGMGADDQACRVAQLTQVFEDRGDGRPAADGAANLVMGDLNTDPFALAGVDPSATFWAERVGEGLPFHYLSSSDDDGPRTYLGLTRIDHVASDTLEGDCKVPGATEGVPPVLDAVYWDHKPVLCDARWP